MSFKPHEKMLIGAIVAVACGVLLYTGYCLGSWVYENNSPKRKVNRGTSKSTDIFESMRKDQSYTGVNYFVNTCWNDDQKIGCGKEFRFTNWEGGVICYHCNQRWDNVVRPRCSICGGTKFPGNLMLVRWEDNANKLVGTNNPNDWRICDRCVKAIRELKFIPEPNQRGWE